MQLVYGHLKCAVHAFEKSLLEVVTIYGIQQIIFEMHSHLADLTIGSSSGLFVNQTLEALYEFRLRSHWASVFEFKRVETSVRQILLILSLLLGRNLKYFLTNLSEHVSQQNGQLILSDFLFQLKWTHVELHFLVDNRDYVCLYKAFDG